ncbi:MAG: sodium:solute symporter family protein [Chlamydiales bacterium]
MKFIFLVLILQTIYWYIGKRSSKNIKTQDDYYLAGKTVTFFPLMMTFLATQVGGGLVLGAADEAYKYGWAILFYPLGNALGLIFLGLGLGRKLAQFQVSTVAQILEVIYRSPLLRKIASMLSVISLFMILAGQIIASKKFLVAMGVPSNAIFVAVWASIILYTVRGGLKAVIATDMAQATLFTLVFLFAFSWVAYDGPFPASIESYAVATSKYTGWLLMPLLFMIIEQDMGQRCFAGESPRTVSKASFWAGILAMLICIIPVYFGVLAKSLGLIIPPGASVLMVAVSTLTNPWITAIVGCAVLAAVISTATSLISAISSNLSSDFFSKQKSLRSMQILTAALSAAAIICAFFFNNVVEMLIQSYELSLSCLLIPILTALFKKQGHFISGILSMVFGIAGFCLFKFVSPPTPSEIGSILLSLAGYSIGEWIAFTQRDKVKNRNPGLAE